MALNFTPLVADATGKVVKEQDFDAEFIAEFEEAWGYLKANPTVPGMSVPFADHKARTVWFNKAVAYGKMHGVAVRKVKGTDSDNKDHGNLSFAMEPLSVKEERAARLKDAAARREILAAMGRPMTRGKKNEAEQAGDDAALQKFYGFSAAVQEKRLAEYREKVAATKAAESK